MSCLCCGKTTEQDRSFCPDCLELAKAYPVPRGAAVSLPDPRLLEVRPRQNYQNRIFSAEEEVLHLRKTVRSLFLTILALCVVLGVLAFLLIHTLDISIPGVF